MNKDSKYKLVYSTAKNFLEDIVVKHPDLNMNILQNHLHPESNFQKISDINCRLIESLQNRSMLKNVINFDEHKSKLKEILFEFEPKEILRNFNNADKLFQKFKSKIPKLKDKPYGKGSLWHQFSEGIIDGSKFMSGFNNKGEFDRYVNKFVNDEDIKDALPMLLAMKIKGFGFPLACDFLKELGYIGYSKPDTHLKRIFYELGLSSSEVDYEVYKSIVEMSEAVNENAYTVDKIFWLIGSGRFYKVKIQITPKGKKFIKVAKKKLEENL